MNVDQASCDKLFFDAQQMMLDLAPMAEKLAELQTKYEAFDAEGKVKVQDGFDMSYLELSSRSTVNAYLQMAVNAMNMAMLAARGTTVGCGATHPYLQVAHQA